MYMYTINIHEQQMYIFENVNGLYYQQRLETNIGYIQHIHRHFTL